MQAMVKNTELFTKSYTNSHKIISAWWKKVRNLQKSLNSWGCLQPWGSLSRLQKPIFVLKTSNLETLPKSQRIRCFTSRDIAFHLVGVNFHERTNGQKLVLETFARRCMAATKQALPLLPPVIAMMKLGRCCTQRPLRFLHGGLFTALMNFYIILFEVLCPYQSFTRIFVVKHV